MFFIQKLAYNIGNFPVIIEHIKLQDATINVILGKNSSGKTSFCEALTSCSPSNDVFVNRHKMIGKDFIYLSSSSPSFFGITGQELLQNYGGNLKSDRIEELQAIFTLPFNNLIGTYSHSMKKIIQFLWLLTYDRKVYLFDDLFASLDEDNISKVKFVLSRIKQEGKIIILTASSLEMVDDFADSIYNLSNGSLKPCQRIVSA